MQTNELKRIHPNMKRMIVARGGKRGKTAGRGGKGQSARAGNKRRPEWRDIIKKIPKLRGRGVNSFKPISDKMVVINLSVLETAFSTNDSITPTILVEKGIINTVSGNIPNIKILGDGEITKALNISGCAISGSAKMKVEKAGGAITPIPSRVIEKVKTPKADRIPTVTANKPQVAAKEVAKPSAKPEKSETKKASTPKTKKVVKVGEEIKKAEKKVSKK